MEILFCAFVYFTANFIDGEALVWLTKRACEELIPVMGHRIKFLKLLSSLKANELSGATQKALLIRPEAQSVSVNEVDKIVPLPDEHGHCDDVEENDESMESKNSQNTRYVHIFEI